MALSPSFTFVVLHWICRKLSAPVVDVIFETYFLYVTELQRMAKDVWGRATTPFRDALTASTLQTSLSPCLVAKKKFLIFSEKEDEGRLAAVVVGLNSVLCIALLQKTTAKLFEIYYQTCAFCLLAGSRINLLLQGYLAVLRRLLYEVATAATWSLCVY